MSMSEPVAWCPDPECMLEPGHAGPHRGLPAMPSRPLSDPTETLAPEDGYTTPERAYETLALIEEHRLRVTPALDGGWIVDWSMQPYLDARGPTIADAVRACVSRIRGQQ